MPVRSLLPSLAFLLLLAGCGPDPGEVETCRRAIGAFEPDMARVFVGPPESDPSDPDGVVVGYRTTDGEARWIACRFSPRRVENAPLELTRVATSQDGEVTGLRLFFLKRWLALERGAPAVEQPSAIPANPMVEQRGLAWLYPLQQTVNGAVLGCIYALLAVGFSLVYGIIGRINFAFGELMMLGAYQTVISAVVLMGLGGAGWGVLPLVLLAAVALTAGQGWSVERLVFRPLRRTPTQIPLIAAIGLSIALQEAARLLQGSRDRWLAPVLTGRLTLAGAEGFSVTISVGQLLAMALTVACSGGLWWMLRRTGFGRDNRACSDDMAMAELLGVDTDRTVGATFALGAACAGAAGFIVALQYGGVNAYMGTLLGFKALAAAIVGGIGSVPGAFLGGLLIAALETGWAAWFPMAFKDIAVFAVLIAVLVMRPTGLLGVERTRGD
ncbi:branched-chain amino acid ABC transporter permease [Skermanella mucosa]|uniref:branched-chain amino acid ABC transporter permease n=1 Tax=Skermanella mucosa TaxID=1789672 RepID=UPI00192B6269|nr:branched-chain amino acid ABC transporter permease [Skermanella mucosa]UEM18922.1 branched-chain amino acid ABC transporter permease [Skermanella mucosa]